MPPIRPQPRALQNLVLSSSSLCHHHPHALSPSSSSTSSSSPPCPSASRRHGSTFTWKVDPQTKIPHLTHAKRKPPPNAREVPSYLASDLVLNLDAEDSAAVRPFDSARDDAAVGQAWDGDGPHKERWRQMSQDARQELESLTLDPDMFVDEREGYDQDRTGTIAEYDGGDGHTRPPQRPQRRVSRIDPRRQEIGNDFFAGAGDVKSGRTPPLPTTRRGDMGKQVLRDPKLFHYGITPVDIVSFALRGKGAVKRIPGDPSGKLDWNGLGPIKQVVYMNGIPWKLCPTDLDVIRWMITFHWTVNRTDDDRLEGAALRRFSQLLPEILSGPEVHGLQLMRRFVAMLLKTPSRREVLLRNMPLVHQHMTDATRTTSREDEIHRVLSLVCSMQMMLEHEAKDDHNLLPRSPQDVASSDLEPNKAVGVLATVGFEAAARLGNIPAMRMQLLLGDKVGVWKSRQGAFAAAAGLERLRNVTALAIGHPGTRIAPRAQNRSILKPALDRAEVLKFLTGVDDSPADPSQVGGSNGPSLSGLNLRSLAMYYGAIDAKGSPSNRNPIMLSGDSYPIDPVRSYFLCLARIGAFRTLYHEWRAHKEFIRETEDETASFSGEAAPWTDVGQRRTGALKHIVDSIRATLSVARAIGEDEAMLSDDIYPHTTLEEAVLLDLKHVGHINTRNLPSVAMPNSPREAPLIRQEEIFEVEKMLTTGNWAEGMRGLAMWTRMRSAMTTGKVPLVNKSLERQSHQLPRGQDDDDYY